MLNHPFPDAFGLDINDLSIKVVELRPVPHHHHRMSFELVTARSTNIPHGLVVDGELLQPEKIRKYIQHLLEGNVKQKPIRGRWVVASLSDRHGFLKLIQIDKDPSELIEEDIIYNAKKHIPFEDDDYYIDWQIMPPDKSAPSVSRVLIGAVQKSIADMHTYLIESLGLGVIALELEPLAIARTMITSGKTYEGEARAILDLGATRSTIIIYDRGQVQFSSSIPFSGEILTTVLSQKLHLTYEEAEKKKIEFGMEFPKTGVGPLLSKAADELVDNIQKAITFYYSHFPDANKITHITMCGGVSATKRLAAVLSFKLKIKAAPGRVWKNLGSKHLPPMHDEEALRFTTAIGLALRASSDPFRTNEN